MTRLSFGELSALARSAGWVGADATVAAAVAMAESRGDPTAVNTSSNCIGLWQVNANVHRQYDPTRLKEPAYNAAAAYAIWKGSGWGAWTTHTGGQYKQFLDGTDSGEVSATTAALPGLGTVDALAGLTDLKFWIRAVMVLTGIGLCGVGVTMLVSRAGAAAVRKVL